MREKISMMKESVLMSLSNITNNKMRSFLTVLGILIGVTAIIALITIVNGVTGQMTDQFASLGTGKLTVSVTGTQLKEGLTQSDMDTLLRIDNVSGIAPSASSSVVAKHGDSWLDEVPLQGRNETYFAKDTSLIARGRALNVLDMENDSRVCILSSGLAETLFYGQDPLGQDVLLNGHTFTVVGLLSDDSGSDVMSQAMGDSGDDKVIIPYTTALKLTGGMYVKNLDVYVEDTDYTDQVVTDIEDTLLAAFNYKEDTYSVINMESLLDTMNSMIAMMTALLAGIASIALVVGGIGIMNMMLVSVTERTMEIGLRKALGAEPYQIQLQFLIEAFVLSLLGGLAGALLGIAISYLFALIIGTGFVISWGAIALGVGFSAAVGIIFGWTPARKASNLNPIDALRSV